MNQQVKSIKDDQDIILKVIAGYDHQKGRVYLKGKDALQLIAACASGEYSPPIKVNGVVIDGITYKPHVTFEDNGLVTIMIY